MKLFLCVLSVLCVLVFVASPSAQEPPEWTKPFPPFRMIGNIYWVGSWDLSSFLITTPAGHILINTGVGDTARQIKKSVEALGFKLEDIKILTTTQGHFDHVAGFAALKRMTGATVMISEPDKALLETGGKADFRFGNEPSAQFEPVKVDRTFKDSDTISLGGTVLTAHIHAGHTKGSTSFTTNIQEGGKTYRVIIANMPSINPGVKMTGMPGFPNIADAYAATFRSLKDTQIDVWLSSHAGQFDLHKKYSPGAPYDPNRFVDPAGFQKAVLDLEKTYQEHVKNDKK